MMIVESIAIYIDEFQRLRARICRRADGLFQHAFETEQPATEEYFAYWRPAGETSGIYETQAEAISALKLVLPEGVQIEGTRLVKIDLNSGYWPEP